MDRSSGSGGRKKTVSGTGKGVSRRGSGLRTGGPVGNRSGYKERRTGIGSGPHSGPGGAGTSGGTGRRYGGVRRGTYGGTGSGRRGGCSLPVVFLILLILILNGKDFLSGLLGGFNSATESQQTYSDLTGTGGLSGLSGTGQTGGSYDAGDMGGGNTGVLNTEVAAGAREKRTVIRGGGQDTVTIMVYMCGTDLESKSGMATSDLTEMTKAKIGEQVNLLVYTGGCSGWQNRTVSSSTNQIYQIKDGGLSCLVQDAGDVSMTKPETLSGYIQWCAQNYPANRYELIFWDHGGGSVSGYGYDQKYPKTGSMNLAGINQALKNGGVSFDFIGFDACLMATMENALMLSQYADYLIASEETEPGIGWYYTDWLTALSKNPSMPTLELGKQITDDFVNECIRKGQGQKVTLSVVDLAELEATAPEALTAFSKSTGDLIRNENYQTVSNARVNTREFAQSSKIDQVDLIHLAKNMGTDEGKQLAGVLCSAVKYNLTSQSMTNAYGLSIYFPYKKVSSVDSIVRTYEQIGMDSEYAKCIQDFASLEVSGQAASGGSSSPLPTLLGETGLGGTLDADALEQLLGSLFSGSFGNVAGLDSSNMGFLSGRSAEDMSGYLADNQFDTGQLLWTTGDDGKQRLCMPDEQWDLIQNLELNLFYDDGEGYIDLGLDNVYQFDEEGNLLGENDGTWLAINGQPVAYYFLDEAQGGDAYMVTGRVPAMLNGQRVNLILIFDEENPGGYIAGAQTDYEEEETQTVAKGLTELQAGDQLDFLCDYYSYDGEFMDSYYLGEPMTVEENMEISNVYVGDDELQATYRLTDIYNQHYWTPPMGQ